MNFYTCCISRFAGVHPQVSGVCVFVSHSSGEGLFLHRPVNGPSPSRSLTEWKLRVISSSILLVLFVIEHSFSTW